MNIALIVLGILIGFGIMSVFRFIKNKDNTILQLQRDNQELLKKNVTLEYELKKSNKGKK